MIKNLIAWGFVSACSIGTCFSEGLGGRLALAMLAVVAFCVPSFIIYLAVAWILRRVDAAVPSSPALAATEARRRRSGELRATNAMLFGDPSRG